MFPVFRLFRPCALTALLALPAAAQDLPYQSLAEGFLADFGRADASPQTLDLNALLQDGFLHVSAGLYDLYLPAEAARKERDVEDYQRVVLALLDAQDRWLEWLEPGIEDKAALRQAHKDHKTLVRWVGSWKPAAIKSGASEGARDLVEVLDPKDAVREALARYGTYMAGGAALGLERGEGRREPVVLMTDRRRMVQMCSLGGWLYPEHQGVFWQPSIATWTHFYIDDIKVLSTRFASPRTPGDYTSGVRMDDRTPTGLEQQIVQLAANSMFANYFGDAIPPTLAGGLAVNLVIDLYGECNTRADGDLRARRTAAREVFIPGGNPDGGILPPNMADSRWRSEQGADHFVSALKRAMPPGSKRGPARFMLEDDRGRRGAEVRAPFLGASASASPLSREYYGDQLEFLRSYRVCFLNWLRAKGAGSSRRSAQAFADLLRGMAAGTTDTLEDTLATVYGAPLSDLAPSKSDLEGRFLVWLVKQKGR
jgi:hypothetical protein